MSVWEIVCSGNCTLGKCPSGKCLQGTGHQGKILQGNVHQGTVLEPRGLHNMYLGTTQWHINISMQTFWLSIKGLT